MPRKKICRKICSYPGHRKFCCKDSQIKGKPVILTVDEYETIHLIDGKGLTQKQCSEMMGVSRPTVAAIYASARKKTAIMITEGRSLVISGGEFVISEEGHGLKAKGSGIMRIAVTYDNGNVFGHFGHTETFKFYDIEEGKIVSEKTAGTGGEGHCALAGFLGNAGTDVLICGGIGPGAVNALSDAGIQVCAGVEGNADNAVRSYIDGTLEYSGISNCGHHDNGHGCRGHEDRCEI